MKRTKPPCRPRGGSPKVEPRHDLCRSPVSAGEFATEYRVDAQQLQRKEVREEPMKSERNGISPTAKPSRPGRAECAASGGWWFHLRRCAQCGHIGCCDSSPSQHASKHYAATGHPVIMSFEPAEHLVLRLIAPRNLLLPARSLPAPVRQSRGSAGARRPAGAVPFKLANAASQIEGGFLVSAWPSADMPTVAMNVGFRERSGHRTDSISIFPRSRSKPRQTIRRFTPAIASCKGGRRWAASGAIKEGSSDR